MGEARRSTYLIQDPYDDDAQRFIASAHRFFGLRPICFYTSAKGRFYGEQQYPMLRSSQIEASYTVDDLEAFAAEVSSRYDVLGIVPFREDTVEVAAELLRYLDIDWNTPEVLAQFRDKHLMKSTLRAQSVRAPRSWEVTAADQLAGADLPDRFVVKPNDGFGNEAIGYFDRDSSTADIAAHIDSSDTEAWVVEEFIDGPEYHVDGQVRSDGTVTVLGVSEYQRISANGYSGVYSGEWNIPTTHPMFDRMVEYATEVIHALELRRCPFHLELIIDEHGPCVIDLGARLPSEAGGGQLSRLHPSRPDVYAVAIHDYLGDNDFATDPVDWVEHDANLQVVVYGVSHEAGVLNNLTGVDEVEADPDFVCWAVEPFEGDALLPTTALRGTPYVVYFTYDGQADAARQRIDDVHRIVRWESSGLTGRLHAARATAKRLGVRARWEVDQIESPASRMRKSAPGYLHEITTLEQWDQLAADVQFATHSRTETVKFVIDLADSATTYFLNSERFDLHVDFVQQQLDPLVVPTDFNITAYRSPTRRFILGSVLHYRSLDRWTIELSGIDNLSAHWIDWMFDTIESRFVSGTTLEFRPVSLGQEIVASEVHQPIVTSDELFAGLDFQAVVPGTAIGMIKIVSSASELSRLRPIDIAVMATVPEEVPPVAAIVTGQFQTPLSHVAVLCRNRETVDMAVRDATTDPSIAAHDGTFVRLTVTNNDFTIESATAAEAEAASQESRPTHGHLPHADLTTFGFVDLADADGHVDTVGAKAQQLAQLKRLGALTTLGGFVIPFGCFVAHLERATAADATQLTARLADTPDDRLPEALAQIRQAIIATPVDAEVLTRLADSVASLVGDGRVILRSSTNAEDLAAFSGAGLYESLPVPAHATTDMLADVLREVWASVWLERAYREREWYRIDHAGVAMAVIAQPFLHDALGVGVALTRNPIDPRADAYLVNVQVPGSGVTGATTDIAEQLVVFDVDGEIEADVISRSSRTAGAPIMERDDLAALAEQLELIHTELLPPHTPACNVMDVEFVMTGDRSITIVQARPYAIAAPDQMTPWTLQRRIRHRLGGIWAKRSPKQRRLALALDDFNRTAPPRSTTLTNAP